MEKIVLLLSFFFIVILCVAQQKIEGTLKTSDGAMISGVNVSLRNTIGRIVAFQSTNAVGFYEIHVPSNHHFDSLKIQINHLGYERVDLSLVADQIRYDFVLQEKVIDISEVEVQRRQKIKSLGDTLSYDVKSFARNEDRSVGDVLSRLPGIEVSAEGQVKFNGTPISNFYLDGDDLLDDRYNIATRTIPHAMVKTLEVLKNHQPIKVLRDVEFSDKVAINLVFEDDAKLKMSAQVKLGIGLPKQYDVEFNSMLFNKKYKMLNVLKGNNVGDDLITDLTSLNASPEYGKPRALLFGSTVGVHGLSKSRYYMNNSASLNFNNLANLKNELQLKVNVAGFVDKNDFVYDSESQIFLSGDTIRYRETRESVKHPYQTDLRLSATQNRANYYLNNSFYVGFLGDKDQAIMQNNEHVMDQYLKHSIQNITNNLVYTPKLKNKDIVHFNWKLHYYNRPESLRITPGVLNNVLNEGNGYKETMQQAKTPTWFNYMSFDYKMPSGVIMQRYTIAFTNEKQDLQSSLRLIQGDGSSLAFSGSRDNSLTWRRNEVELSGNYTLKKRRLESILDLPIKLQAIHYEDSGFDLMNKERRLLFNPNFSIRYKTNIEDFLSLKYAFKNQIGNISGVYKGIILRDYRRISANDAELEERRNHALEMHYNFNRTLQMLFMHVGILYTKSMANTMATSIIDEDISRTVLLPFDNDVSSFSTHAGISKILYELGATVNLKSSWSINRMNQIINDQSLPYENRVFSVNPSIEMSLFNNMNWSYKGTSSWTTSQLVEKVTNINLSDIKVKQYDQTIGLSYTPWSTFFIRASVSHQYMVQPGMQDIQYYFVDAFIRKRILKKDIDIELNLTNLANVKTFETYALTANQFFHSRYRLRGRMVVVKMVFNM